MPNITVLRKDFIKKLDTTKEDNLDIYGVLVAKAKLAQFLKFQTDDTVTFDTGKVSWGQIAYRDSRNNNLIESFIVDNEPCIAVSCNHTTAHFLSRPKPCKPTARIQFATEPAKPEGVPLDAQELKQALTDIIVYTDHKEGRPVLQCVLFEASQGTLKLIGADGFRLAVITLKSPLPDGSFLMSAWDIGKLIKMIGKAEEVYCQVNADDVAWQANNVSLTTQKQPSKFPDYGQLIPKGYLTQAEFVASDMLQAVKALNPIAKDGSGIIRLHIGENGWYPHNIRLAVHAEEYGDTSATIDAMVTADPEHNKIAFNTPYLTDIAMQAKGTIIKMGIKHYTDPAVFTWANRLVVVMPMFVQWV